MSRKSTTIYLLLVFVLLALIGGWYARAFFTEQAQIQEFSGERAYEDVKAQVAFGSRAPGTEGHAEVQGYIRAELEAAGWQAEIQLDERMNHRIENILAKRNDSSPFLLIGAHYDTRFFADQDPDLHRRGEAALGANDGASGVAVLLELARTLPSDANVQLAFFDAEDNGRIEGWDWILGSQAFAENMQAQPRAVVIVDMIGDADLNIYLEKNSDKTIRAEIWNTAAALGYGGRFINEEKYGMLDDHSPFLAKGIPAVDVIDFDYPYWHTAADTADKVSPQSLEAVGRTLWHWIVSQ
ncbi:MAG: M28 family peptidase [Anaerolineales bacterium]